MPLIKTPKGTTIVYDLGNDKGIWNINISVNNTHIIPAIELIQEDGLFKWEITESFYWNSSKSKNRYMDLSRAIESALEYIKTNFKE